MAEQKQEYEDSLNENEQARRILENLENRIKADGKMIQDFLFLIYQIELLQSMSEDQENEGGFRYLSRFEFCTIKNSFDDFKPFMTHFTYIENTDHWAVHMPTLRGVSADYKGTMDNLVRRAKGLRAVLDRKVGEKSKREDDPG